MTDTMLAGANLHHLYVAAINSNDAALIGERLSDDVVFQTPGEPELVGKEAVREWATSFFEAFEAHWDKREQSFEQSGDLAISRYTYTARVRSHEDETSFDEAGKGTCVYRREANGEWLLAIDSWSVNEPVGAAA